METYGAEVVASPSLDDELRPHGARRDARTARARSASPSARRSRTRPPATTRSTPLGSVLNHVLLHQTVIGQEAIEQMGMAGESPDIIIGCAGGGSNFAGLTFPFLGRNFREGAKHRIIAVEPEAAPSLTRGVYAYDFGDTGKMAPLVKMHTLGSDFIPEPIHAGGLRYHGMAPLVSLLKEHGDIEARSVHQRASFEAGVAFARAEGILPGARADPRHPRRHRRGARGQGGRRGRVILFNLCGHGHFDLSAYERYLPARSRTTSTRPRRSRRRWPRLPRRDAEARRAARRGRAHRMPEAAPAGVRAARSTRSRRSSRCSPRSGAARAAGPSSTRAARGRAARTSDRRQNPPDDPGPPDADERRIAKRRAAGRRRRGRMRGLDRRPAGRALSRGGRPAAADR